MAKNTGSKDRDTYSEETEETPSSEIDPVQGDGSMPVVSSRFTPAPPAKMPPLKTPEGKDVTASYTDHPSIVYGDTSGGDKEHNHKVEAEVVIKPRITATFRVGQTWHSIVQGVKVKVPAEVARILEERNLC